MFASVREYSGDSFLRLHHCKDFYSLRPFRSYFVLLLCLGGSGIVGAQGRVRVEIGAQVTVDRPVTPLLYGNFIESGFGRQVDGMWAEMLYNRSFEQVPPEKGKWLQYPKGEDLSNKPWWHSGYEREEWRLAPGNSAAAFRLTEFSGFHHGKSGAFVTNRSKNLPAYLIQKRVYIRSGMEYRFRGFFRGSSVQGRSNDVRVRVGLYSDELCRQALSVKESSEFGSEWFEFSAALENHDFQGFGTFAIEVPPAASLILDDLTLMPADNLGGWRKDVVDALKRARPSIIRFPGGCYASFFHWTDGIGPRSSRMPKESEFWGGLEYNDVGTDEFLNLCTLIGAEPLMVLNMMTSTPEVAADWLAYCNAPESHPLGRLRAANGHPAPYNVKYWELDNETYRKWSAADYASQMVHFSTAMRKINSEIQLVACGYGRFALATEEFLSIAGEHIDLISDRAKGETHLGDKIRLLRSYGQRTGRKIRLCNTEWLAPWGEVPLDSAATGGPLLDQTIPRQEQQITWRYALNTARTLMMFQRLGGDFEFANFNNMANTWGQNIIECPKEEAFLSAAGLVFELFSEYPVAWPLLTRVESAGKDVVAQAAWNRDKTRLILVALNYRETEVDLLVDVSDLGLSETEAKIVQIHSESLWSHNSTSNPQRISRRSFAGQLSGDGKLGLKAPHYSVTRIVF